MADEGKENQADPQVHPALETKVLQGYYKKLYRFQQIYFYELYKLPTIHVHFYLIRYDFHTPLF